MVTDETLLSLREQAREALERRAMKDVDALERLCESGDPLTDEDRTLVKMAMLVLKGEVYTRDL